MKEDYFLRWIGFGIFALIVWLFFPFLKSFFVALLMVMATYPIYHLIEVKIKRYKKLKNFASVISAAIITLVVSLIVFMPITIFLFKFLSYPSDSMTIFLSFWNKIDVLSKNLPSYLEWIRSPLDTIIPMVVSRKEEITAFLAGWLGNGLRSFMIMLGDMIMIVVFFFFLTLYSRRLIFFFTPIVPLSHSLKREFFTEMRMMVSVVFYTLVGVMIAQGLAFGVFIAFFDGYNPLLLGFLVAIVSIFPIFGTGLVWVPIAVNEYLDGNIINALIISLYSYMMMTVFIDNIVKIIILNFVNRRVSKNKHHINEFIIFFAIVGGLATFGFWGFILGPAIIALAITTLITLRKANGTSLAHKKRHLDKN